MPRVRGERSAKGPVLLRREVPEPLSAEAPRALDHGMSDLGVRASSNPKAVDHGGLVRRASGVLIKSVAAHAILFGFTVVVARILSPVDYGLFASLFAIVALSNVVLAAFQTSVATDVSADSNFAVARIETAWRASFALAAGSFVIIVGLSPYLTRFLKAPAPWPLVATAAIVACYLPWNVLLGGYQGSMRFREYGNLMLLQAIARLGALVGLVLFPTPFALLLLIAVAMVPPLILGSLGFPLPVWRSLFRVAAARDYVQESLRRTWRPILVAVALGFPSLGDVILVRHLYEGSAAGTFSGVALIGRIVLLLPAAINTVLYPSFVKGTRSQKDLRRMRNAGLAVAALVGPLVLLAFAVPSLVLVASVGPAYATGAPLIGPYSLCAAFYAIASVAAYYNLAAQDTRFLLLCVAPHLMGQVLAPFLIHTLVSMTWAMAAIAGSFAICSIAWSILRSEWRVNLPS